MKLFKWYFEETKISEKETHFFIRQKDKKGDKILSHFVCIDNENFIISTRLSCELIIKNHNELVNIIKSK